MSQWQPHQIFAAGAFFGMGFLAAMQGLMSLGRKLEQKRKMRFFVDE